MNHQLGKSVDPSDTTTARRGQYDLYEVWGDTVDAKHLTLAILVGGAVSLGAYALALSVLSSVMESAQMAKAYAMLIGILGCLAGGAVSAMLFKPKRDVVEHVADPAYREQVVNDLLKEYGTLGRLEDTSPEVIAELHELGLYELFLQAQEKELSDRAESERSAPEEYEPVALSGGRQ
jgi:multidrug transporter EmrE-like cation transporter